ncbi:transporter substrate-binding domain-containing protein [Marinovum sp.]|uniref:transporter substrate-binding domain-containing protein n=1 Tax=Marinovum sp. TaxID=2024839 RepID=UPI003A8D0CB3
MRYGAAAAVFGLILGTGAAQAGCNETRQVEVGDTFFSLAKESYGDHEQWTLIYYANQALLEDNTFKLVPGTEIYVPCAPGQAAPVTEDATPLQRPDAEMVLLTGSNYAPFTDTDWPGQGMATELVNAALESAPAPVPYAIVWEDDWSKHLFPLLDDKQVDMGFPWLKPDCAATPDNERCANFHFSDPLVEILIMLFVRADDSFDFADDADILGKTLCRPKGYFTHDLDRDGRNWLSQGLITLVRAESPQACFDLLTAGTVDAVTVNVFLGANTLDAMGLRGKVVPLERPLSTEGLHVVISKTHWRGTTFLYRVNAGLAALKESARYNEIVARHLAVFWDRMQQGS